MLKCRDVIEQADRYVDGRMNWRERLGFRMHLMLCRYCHRYIKNLSLLTRTLGGTHHNTACQAEEAEIEAVYNKVIEAETSDSSGHQ